MLVIVGTFLFYRAVVITILKLLRSNKQIYYRGTNMTFIAELLKRSKESAMSLASITIIVSMLLACFTMTVAMFIGKNQVVKRIAPRDYVIQYNEAKDTAIINETLHSIKNEINATIKDEVDLRLSRLYMREDTQCNFSLEHNSEFLSDFRNTGLVIGSVISIGDFNKIHNCNIELNDNEVLLYNSAQRHYDTIKVAGIQLAVKQNLKKIDYICVDSNASLFSNILFVVKDLDSFNTNIKNMDAKYTPTNRLLKGINVVQSDNPEKFDQLINDRLLDNHILTGNYGYLNGRLLSVEFTNIHKGAYITIILLSFILFVSAVIAVYYKQASEGFSDSANIEMLSKAGLSNKEIKQSVVKQNYVSFFAPLVVGIIHIIAAGKLMYNMLHLLAMMSVNTFIIIEALCIVAFSVVYVLIFRFTMPVYFTMGRLNHQ